MWYFAGILFIGFLLMPRRINQDFNTFEACVDFILEKESGYVNNPEDPGGETKYGITKKYYPSLDIKNLTIEQAKEIYKRDYWDKLIKLDFSLNLIAFDCAVNQGLSFSNAVNQEVNYLTPLSPEGKLNYFYSKREQRYRANKNYIVFGKGWMNRLNEVYSLSKNRLNINNLA